MVRSFFLLDSESMQKAWGNQWSYLLSHGKSHYEKMSNFKKRVRVWIRLQEGGLREDAVIDKHLDPAKPEVFTSLEHQLCEPMISFLT